MINIENIIISDNASYVFIIATTPLPFRKWGGNHTLLFRLPCIYFITISQIMELNVGHFLLWLICCTPTDYGNLPHLTYVQPVTTGYSPIVTI